MGFHVRGGEYVTLRMFPLPVLPKLVLGVEHVHVHETATATKQVRDEAGVEALADTARVHRDEGAHDADTSQRQAYRSELALQGGRVVKLQHPVFVSGRVVWRGTREKGGRMESLRVDQSPRGCFRLGLFLHGMYNNLCLGAVFSAATVRFETVWLKTSQHVCNTDEKLEHNIHASIQLLDIGPRTTSNLPPHCRINRRVRLLGEFVLPVLLRGSPDLDCKQC